MESVDVLLVGKYVITLDKQNRVIPRGAVAIKDGIIVDVDEEGRVRDKYKAEVVMERRHHIVLPGLVDCHTHTQQYLLRSAIDDLMLQLPPVWTKVLVPFERSMDENMARISSRASIANMLRNGTTFFVEAGAPYPEVLAEEVLRSGIKGAVTYATYDVSDGERVSDPESVVRRARELYEKYHGAGDNLRVWMSIRQVMMASEGLIEEIMSFARERRTGITLHLSEYQGEVDYTLAKYGKRPLEHMIDRRLHEIKPAIIAHGVFLSPGEVALARKHGIGICWCPTVDSWLMGVHWAGFTETEGVALGIGSDGGAWNKLDLLHEIKVAKALGKAAANAIAYFKAGLRSSELLTMATGHGGSMVGEKLGRLEKGYSADIVVLDYRALSTVPLHNPLDLVANYAEGGSVSDVLVNGRPVVENGRLLTIDEEKLLEELLDLEDEVRSLVGELSKRLPLKAEEGARSAQGGDLA